MIVAEASLFEISRRFSTSRKVFTVGSFDLLHVGHVEYLNWCAGQGDVLIVGVNNNASITRDKGSTRPIIPESDRVLMVDSLRMVDVTVLTESLTGCRTKNQSKLLACVVPTLLSWGMTGDRPSFPIGVKPF